MKVKQYNEMMAYLTRPGFNTGGSVNFNGGGSVKKKPVLPKRKPAAEIKRRQKINYEKIKQYLGEESQEFIERELGFAMGGRASYFKGGITSLYKGIKGLQQGRIQKELINKYKSEGMNLIEALNKANLEATQIVKNRKLKIIQDKLNETSVLTDDYVTLIDEEIKLNDPELFEDIIKFEKNNRPDLADKIRALRHPDWAEANFGKNYEDVLQDRQNKAIKQMMDDIPNVKERTVVDDIDDMNQANIDEFLGRKKNAEGGRVGFKKGDKVKQTQQAKNIKARKQSLDRIAEIIQQADIDDNITYLLTKSDNNPTGKMTDSLVQAINKAEVNDNEVRYIAKALGEDVEYVLDVFDERREAGNEARLTKMMSGSRIKEVDTRAKFEKIEKWMTSNAKNFNDPKKFKIAIEKRFGTNNILNRAAKQNQIPLFTQGFTNEVLGVKGFSGDTSRLTKSLLNNIYASTLYNFNPEVRSSITKEFKDILSGGPAKVKQEARARIKNSELLKKFNLDKKIQGPISRLIYKEVGEELYRNIQTFRAPRAGTDDLIRYLSGVVDPKYKPMFEEAVRSIDAFKAGDKAKAVGILKRGEKIMYDHKIPSALIDNGYADPIEYIKFTPVTEEFNIKIKNSQFDKPISDLLRKYEATDNLDRKKIIYQQIVDKKNSFSKKYGGYLDDVSITRTPSGQVKFSSNILPVTKSTDLLGEFTKAGLQTNINNAANRRVFEKFAKESGLLEYCGLAEGVDCGDPNNYKKGLEDLIRKAKAGSKVAAKALTQIAINVPKAGRFVKNVLGPGAILGEILFEGAVIGNDMLDGTPFKQAAGKSYINEYLLGPKLKINVDEEIKKEQLTRVMPDGSVITLEDTPENILKGEEFVQGKRGRFQASLPGGTAATSPVIADRVQEQRIKEMKQKFPGISEDIIRQQLLKQDPKIDLNLFPMQSFKQILDDQIKTEYFADNFRQEKAGGGIMKMAGKSSGPPPTSGPTPDGPSEGLAFFEKNGIKR